jgi:hypothetical protein
MAIEEAQMQDFAKRYGQLVARAWGDQAFKAQLLAEPTRALAEQGIQLPPGVEVRMVENTDRVLHLALPPKPPDELSDEQLDAVAGGDTAGSAGTVSTLGSVCTTLASAGCAGSAGTAS